MSQSFRRWRWQLRLDPISQVQILGCALSLTLLYQSLDGIWILGGVLWVLACALAQRLAALGWPRWFSMPLTPNFYAVRALNGRWSIFQRPPAKGVACRELLKGLVQEGRLLPAALPPGRYQALTHGLVLRRLRAMEHVTALSARAVYVQDLARLTTRMAGGRCRSCEGPCPFPRGQKDTRQFFFVTFEIM